ncbi:MAG: hypothetical protein ACFFHD_11055 [Promethearchaeota archaeon]
MVTEPNLKIIFQEWNELNVEAQESLGQFDFSKIKEIRKKQKEIEDLIFEILKSSAPDNIKELLPDDCGEMEVGYESEEKTFYFVMFDPESEDNEDTTLIAITINTNKDVKIIKDFKME